MRTSPLQRLSACTIAIAIATALACAVAACGVSHRLSSATVAAVPGTLALSGVGQREVTIDWISSSRGQTGSMSGLFVSVIDEPGDLRREEAANARALPLQQQTQDVDFQTAYAAALEGTLNQIDWLKLQSFERNDHVAAGLFAFARVSPPAPPVSDTDVQGRAVLRIGTNYFLSADSVVLSIVSEFGFYQAGRSKTPAAQARITYLSEGMEGVRDEAAVRLWAKDRAHAYRDALQLGITENMKMTRMALGYMAGTDYAGAAVVLNVRIESATWDFDIARVPIHVAGTIIDETGNRLILQTESAFLSIPKSTIESRVVTGKKRGVVWQPPANSP